MNVVWRNNALHFGRGDILISRMSDIFMSFALVRLDFVTSLKAIVTQKNAKSLEFYCQLNKLMKMERKKVEDF